VRGDGTEKVVLKAGTKKHLSNVLNGMYGGPFYKKRTVKRFRIIEKKKNVGVFSLQLERQRKQGEKWITGKILQRDSVAQLKDWRDGIYKRETMENKGRPNKKKPESNDRTKNLHHSYKKVEKTARLTWVMWVKKKGERGGGGNNRDKKVTVKSRVYGKKTGFKGCEQ